MGEGMLALRRRQKITRKISLGYGVSFGIAVVGVGAGIVAGSLHEERASRDRDIAVRKAELITRLENDTLTLALHPQHLVVATEQRLWLRYEMSQFKSDIVALQSSMDRVDALVKGELAANDPSNLKRIGELGQKLEITDRLRAFISDYQIWAESLWKDLQANPDDAVGQLQRRETRLTLLVEALGTPEAKDLQLRLESLTEQLTIFVNTADQREKEAFERFQSARLLSVAIILASFALSLGLAIACGFFVSRAIARPIHDLTNQTHRITQEENFDLQVAVGTEDETAQLAASIDQLVRWAGQYTRELKKTQVTLEQQVEERTKELRMAQAQAVQSEKMSSLGQMVAGVAHEINNPVGFIYSNISHATEYVEDLLDLLRAYREALPEEAETEAIAQKVEDMDLEFLEEDVIKVLGSMRMGANRIKEIVLSLRTFSRLDESGLKEASLRDGIDSTLTILGHRLKANSNRGAIQVVRDYGDLPPISCYAGQLNQVFMNLLANAIDAMEEALERQGLSLRIVPLGASSSQPQPQIVVTTRMKGNYQVVTISDNGPGIHPEVCDRIFDPFFTTKPTGKGTGMGLAISYQIVADRHNGQISCASTPGQGTTFTIEIPIKKIAAPPTAAPEEDQKSHRVAVQKSAGGSMGAIASQRAQLN
ncbi:MAG: ATP-binding protein [Cyanobacteria bacterium P01_C01_bin.89]